MMTAASTRKIILASLLLSSALPAASPAAAAPLPDSINLGDNRSGQPCSATRDWSRSSGAVKSAKDQSFVVTCRSSSAAKIVAVVQPAAIAAKAGARDCGAATNLALEGIGAVTARMCQDAGLGIQVVEIQSGEDGKAFVGAASVEAVAPMLRMLRSSTGGFKADLLDWAPVVDVSILAPAPSATASGSRLSDFNPEGALQQGVLAIRSGELVTASRGLNDALSRVGAETSPAVVAELQLNAALADSGLGQFGPARKGFAAAEAILRKNSSSERAAYLERALRTYRSFDAINQREWDRALTELNAITQETRPLSNPVVLSTVNRDSEKSKSNGISLRDKSQYNWLVLDVQQNYARSLALLGLNRIDESRAALYGPGGAISSFRVLDQVAQPASVNWLRARVQMQVARIEARAKNSVAALAAYDCALATMQGRAAPPNCPIGLTGKTSEVSFAGDTSAIAALQLERATFASQAGLPVGDVAAQYREAVDTVVTSGRSSSVQAPALIGYFEFLLGEAKKGSNPALQEEYFRLMQVVSDPAIAGDMVKLESVIAADGTIAEDLRARVELDRQITGLRYQIAALPAGSDAERAKLERQRAAAEAEKQKIEITLASDARFSKQDDTPISIAELRQNLREGEVYLKLARIRTRLYGMAISRDNAWTYGIEAPADSVEGLARRVISTSRSQISKSGKTTISPFDVETAHGLFNAIAGPASGALASAKYVVFDPAGQLRTMPAGVLVTDSDSVKRFKAAGKSGSFNYTKVNFLASQAEIATSISPRSFTVVRSKVAPSTAPKPLLGLGENAPAALPSPAQAIRPVFSGVGCSVNYGPWVELSNSNVPISARQLEIVSQSLGVPGAPSMTGAAFTDTGIQAASESGELSQYQVLHFATHGTPQNSAEIEGCQVDLPPSLISTIAPASDEGPIVSNGLLSYDKIARLKLNANLVVLAACETSSGAEAIAGRAAGQEDTSQAALDGLVRAFISANARAVIATYWRIPANQQGDDLMGALYSAGRTGTIGEALKTAQGSLIRNAKSSHPYYWGAFFVVGDTAKHMLTGTGGGASSAKR